VPKPKATEVIVHRIDLQPSMKESMDNFLIGKTVTNALQAVGSIASAAGPALAVLVGWWIADKTLDDLKGGLDKIVENTRGKISEGAAADYQAISAFLYPMTYPLDYHAMGLFKKGPDGKKTNIKLKWMRKRFQAFMNQTQQVMFIAEMQKQNKTPAEAWALFYPWEEMENEAVAELNKIISSRGWVWDLITPNPKE